MTSFSHSEFKIFNQRFTLCQMVDSLYNMDIYQGCNRIVQYSVQPNNIRRIVDIRLPTEYQYSVFS